LHPTQILIGFYMIATKVENVYEVFLPADVRTLLRQLRFVISLGIDGVPLACVGASGYTERLLFWILTPIGLVALAILVVAVRLRLGRRTTARDQENSAPQQPLWLTSLPIVLRIFFLIYPIVTNVAFEAFSCYRFESGRGWLVADVGIECGTQSHNNARALARLAIILYPIGIFVLNSVLLYTSREAIKTGKPSRLSVALNFVLFGVQNFILLVGGTQANRTRDLCCCRGRPEV
jgi:hypothetical protein